MSRRDGGNHEPAQEALSQARRLPWRARRFELGIEERAESIVGVVYRNVVIGHD